MVNVKWERYNKMTTTQKEEYDYRFKRDVVEMPVSISQVSVLYSMVVMLLMICYLALKHPEIGISEATVLNFLDVTGTIMSIIIPVIVVEVLYWIGCFGWRNYKEYKWLKEVENNGR